MKSQNQATNAKNLPTGVVRSDTPEANIKKVPTLEEIRRRALEIHFERSGHVCDMDGYLDEWLQAARELREKYNRSNDEGATKPAGCQATTVSGSTMASAEGQSCQRRDRQIYTQGVS